MRVGNWMTRTAPVVKESLTVGDALKAMEFYGVGELAVVDEDGRFVGVLNKDDIMDKDSSRKVTDFVVLPELYVSEHDPIENAMLSFMETSEEFVPVVDEDMRVIGIVTLQDVLESMIEITAMDEPGCRISLVLEDVPGALKKVVDALAENNVNILSILTFREDGRRRVVMRVDLTDSGEVERILKIYDIDYDSVVEEEGF